MQPLREIPTCAQSFIQTLPLARQSPFDTIDQPISQARIDTLQHLSSPHIPTMAALLSSPVGAPLRLSHDVFASRRDPIAASSSSSTSLSQQASSSVAAALAARVALSSSPAHMRNHTTAAQMQRGEGLREFQGSQPRASQEVGYDDEEEDEGVLDDEEDFDEETEEIVDDIEQEDDTAADQAFDADHFPKPATSSQQQRIRDELPPDFDRSFGSSMSISTSYDREAADRIQSSLFATALTNSVPSSSVTTSRLPPSTSTTNAGPSASYHHLLSAASSTSSVLSASPSNGSVVGKRAPGSAKRVTLGEALGTRISAVVSQEQTSLPCESPNLLSKLLHPGPMDISSPAKSPTVQIERNNPQQHQLYAQSQPDLLSSSPGKALDDDDALDLFRRPKARRQTIINEHGRPTITAPRTLRRRASELQTRMLERDAATPGASATSSSTLRGSAGPANGPGTLLGKLFNTELSLQDKPEPISPSQLAVAASQQQKQTQASQLANTQNRVLAKHASLPTRRLGGPDLSGLSPAGTRASALSKGKHARNLSPRGPSSPISPDQRPPNKRRPNSLPLGAGRLQFGNASGNNSAGRPSIPAALVGPHGGSNLR